jgi:hypothetical protein
LFSWLSPSSVRGPCTPREPSAVPAQRSRPRRTAGAAKAEARISRTAGRFSPGIPDAATKSLTAATPTQSTANAAPLPQPPSVSPTRTRPVSYRHGVTTRLCLELRASWHADHSAGQSPAITRSVSRLLTGPFKLPRLSVPAPDAASSPYTSCSTDCQNGNYQDNRPYPLHPIPDTANSGMSRRRRSRIPANPGSQPGLKQLPSRFRHGYASLL